MRIWLRLSIWLRLPVVAATAWFLDAHPVLYHFVSSPLPVLLYMLQIPAAESATVNTVQIKPENFPRGIIPGGIAPLPAGKFTHDWVQVPQPVPTPHPKPEPRR
jgi:hypothetical protein